MLQKQVLSEAEASILWFLQRNPREDSSLKTKQNIVFDKTEAVGSSVTTHHKLRALGGDFINASVDAPWTSVSDTLRLSQCFADCLLREP